MRVLVGYASVSGSTEGIATRIAERLRAHAFEVDVAALGAHVDAGRYDAFVLGSAIHDQAWLAPAMEFVTRQTDALAARPVWLFSVGMPAALARPLRAVAATERGKVAARLPPAIRPQDHELFSGVVRRAQLPGIGRLFFRLLGGRYGDFRDWRAIDTWADAIAQALERASRITR